ncbi:hypothetical protein OsccyDRAFT_4202 [Leptolyngbyaceae cyanobacterium JSC-12]|nr:hypothetical protein OsccyDRAFT_4202 [Leptolyngbyaceae cyanobacterium JSC-12]
MSDQQLYVVDVDITDARLEGLTAVCEQTAQNMKQSFPDVVGSRPD